MLHRSSLTLSVLVAGLVAVGGCEPELPSTSRMPASSRLGIAADGATLYVALADHDEVRAIDAATGETRARVVVPGQPHRLTVLRDGRVAVTARLAGTVSVVDVEGGEVVGSVVVGSEPWSVVQVGDELVVAVAGEGDLARVALSSMQITSRITLPHDDPRGLAVVDDAVLVSHFTARHVSKVDLVRGVVVDDITVQLASLPQFFANQLDQLTTTSDGGQLVIPHVECNNNPGQFSGSFAGAGPSPAYYAEAPTGFSAVVPAITRVDVVGGFTLSDDDSAAVFTNVEAIGPASPLINPVNQTRLAGTRVNAPVAVALVHEGSKQLELVVAAGSGNVLVRRAWLQDGQDSIVGTVDVGVGADSIVLSSDGDTAYVFNPFAQTLTRFEVPELIRGDGRAAEGNRDRAIVAYEGTTTTIVEQALPAEVVRGRELFHAVDARLTSNGAIACASCHPGGGDDGTTWAFAEGPRQSPPLWGGITGTEPFHWDQSVLNMADISRATIIARMGGTGLSAVDMNAIGAWLDTIPAPAGRTTNADFNGSSERGAVIFSSTATGCTECHSGVDRTDNRAHDVSTGVGFAVRESAVTFATPPLKGLAHSGPYLHDGSAATLRELVMRTVVTNQMGRGSHLTAGEIDDLVAFLENL